MKVIILAGGLGTRISEETDTKPKPMVLLDDKPIIWHIMNVFARQGIDEFLIATGYKGEVIREWVETVEEPWKITAVDTGLETQTGGRIAECMRLIPGEQVFATYGDGLANVNLRTLMDFHEHHDKLATITAVRPPARFGVLESENGLVTKFGEKNQADSGWINGGFFLLEPSTVNYIQSPSEPFESGALPRLVGEKQLMSFHHNGFWKPMDTLRERNELVEMAKQITPPWLANLND
jgi:glucose-1-phosphate cytidylyltransferase